MYVASPTCVNSLIYEALDASVSAISNNSILVDWLFTIDDVFYLLLIHLDQLDNKLNYSAL